MSSATRWVVFATTVGLAVATAAAVFAGTDEAGIRVGLRGTALVGYPLLVSCFAAPGLVQLWPNRFNEYLASRRRQLGLAFAGVWAVHLAQIGWFLSLPPDPPLTLGGAAPGISGYLFLVGLVIFSVPRIARSRPRASRFIRRVGEQWVFAIFTLALANAGMTQSALWFIPLAGAAAAYVIRGLSSKARPGPRRVKTARSRSG